MTPITIAKCRRENQSSWNSTASPAEGKLPEIQARGASKCIFRKAVGCTRLRVELILDALACASSLYDALARAASLYWSCFISAVKIPPRRNNNLGNR